MAKTVVGMFESANDAQSAMQSLQSGGFSQDNTSLIRSASSGVSNIFGQLGIPQHDADLYQAGLRSGGALIVLQGLGNDDANNVATILDRHNAVDLDNIGQRFSSSSELQTTGVSSSMQTTQSTTGIGTTTGGSGRRNFYEGGETVIPIVEEEIHVGKREVESGGVRVHTRVEERPVNEQVTLRDEQVHVERIPVDRPIDESTVRDLDEAFIPVTVEMREHNEQAVVSKEARVVEEVVVNKEARERTETIQDTVRRTDVDVEEAQGQMRTSAVGQTGSATRQTGGSTHEGAIERGASGIGNAMERGTGLDIDQDGDVGQRDTRNNY